MNNTPKKPVRKRQRKPVKVACKACRESHIACNDVRPCLQCVRRGKQCVDEYNVVYDYGNVTAVELWGGEGAINVTDEPGGGGEEYVESSPQNTPLIGRKIPSLDFVGVSRKWSSTPSSPVLSLISTPVRKWTSSPNTAVNSPRSSPLHSPLGIRQNSPIVRSQSHSAIQTHVQPNMMQQFSVHREQSNVINNKQPASAHIGSYPNHTQHPSHLLAQTVNIPQHVLPPQHTLPAQQQQQQQQHPTVVQQHHHQQPQQRLEQAPQQQQHSAPTDDKIISIPVAVFHNMKSTINSLILERELMLCDLQSMRMQLKDLNALDLNEPPPKYETSEYSRFSEYEVDWNSELGPEVQRYSDIPSSTVPSPFSESPGMSAYPTSNQMDYGEQIAPDYEGNPSEFAGYDTSERAYYPVEGTNNTRSEIPTHFREQTPYLESRQSFSITPKNYSISNSLPIPEIRSYDIPAAQQVLKFTNLPSPMESGNYLSNSAPAFYREGFASSHQQHQLESHVEHCSQHSNQVAFTGSQLAQHLDQLGFGGNSQQQPIPAPLRGASPSQNSHTSVMNFSLHESSDYNVPNPTGKPLWLGK